MSIQRAAVRVDDPGAVEHACAPCSVRQRVAREISEPNDSLPLLMLMMFLTIESRCSNESVTRRASLLIARHSSACGCA
jgi:hypothetical protein